MTEPTGRSRLAFEGVVIVVSVLLAFAVDAWWDQRREVELEGEVLSAVAVELEANRRDLAEVLAVNEADLEAIDFFLRATPQQFAGLPEDDRFPALLGLFRVLTFNPRTGASTLLTESQVLDRRGVEVRTEVSEALRQLDDLFEEHSKLEVLEGEVRRIMAAYAARSAPDGNQNVARMIARQPASVLGELRSDSALVAAVTDKGSLHRFYVVEMRAALEKLDHAASALSPD